MTNPNAEHIRERRIEQKARLNFITNDKSSKKQKRFNIQLATIKQADFFSQSHMIEDIDIDDPFISATYKGFSVPGLTFRSLTDLEVKSIKIIRNNKYRVYYVDPDGKLKSHEDYFHHSDFLRFFELCNEEEVKEILRIAYLYLIKKAIASNEKILGFACTAKIYHQVVNAGTGESFGKWINCFIRASDLINLISFSSQEKEIPVTGHRGGFHQHAAHIAEVFGKEPSDWGLKI